MIDQFKHSFYGQPLTILSGFLETRLHTSRIEDKNLELACASRTELIPRFARAKNIKGKWKYLLQASDGNVQNYQVGRKEAAAPFLLVDVWDSGCSRPSLRNPIGVLGGNSI